MQELLGDLLTKFSPAIKIGALGAIALKGSQILDLINEIRHNSIKNIQKQLAFKHLDVMNKAVLQESLNRLVFKKATGIDQPKEIREWIIKTIERSKGSLRLRAFYQAQKYICNNGESISINFTKYRYIFASVSLAYGLGMTLSSMAVLVAGIVAVVRSEMVSGIVIISLSPIMVIIGISMLNDAASFYAAKKLNESINSFASFGGSSLAPPC
jgi:hypothetical protein